MDPLGASAFERASAVRPVEDGVFEAIVPEGWQQGRGAFGGLVLGVLARALTQVEPDAMRTMRALNAEICGPVLAGAARIATRVLRRGSGLTTVEAWLDQGGDVLARASAILAAPRATSGPRLPAVRAETAPWEDSPVLPVAPPIGPVFAQQFEYRSVGPYPYSGHAEAVATGWIRFREPPARIDAAVLMAYLDAYWPSSLVMATGPRPAATVSFAAEIVADLTRVAPDTPFFHRGRAVAQTDGYVVELRELYAGGVLVALNQQVFALLG